jgi:hypothetical protein
MIIISSYTEQRNKKTGVYAITADNTPPCPLCSGELKYRDSRLRMLKNLLGEAAAYLLRRLRCAGCNKLHTEFPDIIQPYKHYDSATIQCVIDGGEDASRCAADDSTMRRWKSEFAESEADIAQRLAAVHAKETGSRAPTGAGAAALAGIRAAVARWLAYVMELLINGGHVIRTRFAFCPAPSLGMIKENPGNGGKGG